MDGVQVSESLLSEVILGPFSNADLLWERGSVYKGLYIRAALRSRLDQPGRDPEWDVGCEQFQTEVDQ